MGLISDYRATLKAPEVEEHVDLWVHRPLGYVIAKLAMPTPVTPNQITLVSIAWAVAASAFLLADFPYHLVVGGAAIVLSAAFDCADGQLARMRKTSSALGRMLDGVADVASIGSAAVGAFAVLAAKFAPHGEPRGIAVLLGLSALTIVTSSNHTAAYDHYKNVWLRLTTRSSEGEDLERAIERRAVEKARGMSFVDTAIWVVYIGYLERQRAFLKRFDPFTSLRLDALPAFDPVRAEIYRRHAARTMWMLRAFFGTGTLLFTLALSVAFDCPEVIIVFRVVVLTPLLYLVIGPLQRRASQAAFEEMGFSPDGVPATAAA